MKLLMSSGGTFGASEIDESKLIKLDLININAPNGFPVATHEHDTSHITSGTFDIARIPLIPASNVEYNGDFVSTALDTINSNYGNLSIALRDKISLKSNTDNSSVNTIPNDYNSVFEIKGLKYNATIGVSAEGTGVGASYSCVLGMRGWSDPSGGNAHEFALTGYGNIKHRTGSDTTWSAWKTLAYKEDIDTILTNYATKAALDNKTIKVLSLTEYANITKQAGVIYFVTP